MEVVREGVSPGSIVIRSNVLMEAEQRELIRWMWNHRYNLMIPIVCEGCPEIMESTL